eukprot:2171029-Rhodomonas_salina.1
MHRTTERSSHLGICPMWSGDFLPRPPVPYLSDSSLRNAVHSCQPVANFRAWLEGSVGVS